MAFRLLLLAFLWLSISVSFAEPLDQLGRPVDDSVMAGSAVRFKIDLEGATDNVTIARLKDGGLVYIVKRPGAGTDRMLRPEEFTKFYFDQRSSHGWFYDFLNYIFNTTSLAGMAWVGLGFLGQFVFMGRMLVQWFASEKSKRSVIPVSFWWLSIVGSTMLLVYFIWRRDAVGIIGQGLGWIVYVRNLVLIHRSRS